MQGTPNTSIMTSVCSTPFRMAGWGIKSGRFLTSVALGTVAIGGVGAAIAAACEFPLIAIGTQGVSLASVSGGALTAASTTGAGGLATTALTSTMIGEMGTIGAALAGLSPVALPLVLAIGGALAVGLGIWAVSRIGKDMSAGVSQGMGSVSRGFGS